MLEWNVYVSDFNAKEIETYNVFDNTSLIYDCKYNNACLTQAFVEEASRVPFDRNTFFCADGVKREEN